MNRNNWSRLDLVSGLDVRRLFPDPVAAALGTDTILATMRPVQMFVAHQNRRRYSSELMKALTISAAM